MQEWRKYWQHLDLVNTWYFGEYIVHVFSCYAPRKPIHTAVSKFRYMSSRFNFICLWNKKLTSHHGFWYFCHLHPTSFFSTADMVLYATSASGPRSALLSVFPWYLKSHHHFPLCSQIISWRRLAAKIKLSCFMTIIFGLLLLGWWTIWKSVCYPSWHRGRYSGQSHGTFHFLMHVIL